MLTLPIIVNLPGNVPTSDKSTRNYSITLDFELKTFHLLCFQFHYVFKRKLSNCLKNFFEFDL